MRMCVSNALLETPPAETDISFSTTVGCKNYRQAF